VGRKESDKESLGGTFGLLSVKRCLFRYHHNIF